MFPLRLRCDWTSASVLKQPTKVSAWRSWREKPAINIVWHSKNSPSTKTDIHDASEEGEFRAPQKEDNGGEHAKACMSSHLVPRTFCIE